MTETKPKTFTCLVTVRSISPDGKRATFGGQTYEVLELGRFKEIDEDDPSLYPWLFDCEGERGRFVTVPW